MKKPTSTPRRVRSDVAQADPDPYKPARRPARAVGARSDAPRSAPRSAPRAAPRGDRPTRNFDRSDRPARSFDRSDRPVRSPRPPRDGDSAPRYGARPFGGGEDRGGFADRGDRASGFTVNLDSDVARVFRGDASVNKALRLVMQLMQVVQGPPPREGGRFGSGERTERPRSPGGYRGTAEARGFERKPRFEESDDGEE